MMIRRESKLADLITGAGLLGSSHASETDSTTSIEATTEQQAPCRPCSAPASRPNSSSRQLSRANSRAATIVGLQSSASRWSRSSSVAGGGATVVQEEFDARPGQVKRSSSAKSGRLAWKEQQSAGDQTNEQALQHLQEHNQQLLQLLEHLKQQLQHADASQHNLEELLQQQASDHQAALQDLQAQYDNSSNKLFRDLKAAQAAKEQALSKKRSAEQATRDVQQEFAAVQSKCQQQQQQLAALEERLATAARKVEQQVHAHEEASRRPAGKAERKLQQLKEQLAAKEMAIKAAEDSLRQELHRRTGTILSMQAQLEQQDSALVAAAAQQAELQGKVQELQAQLTYPPTANHSQAGDEQIFTDESYSEQHKNRQHGVTTSQNHCISFAADNSSNCHAADAAAGQPPALGHSVACLPQRQIKIQQPHAADPHNANSSSLLNRQLQLPAGPVACSSTLPAAAEAQAVIAATLQECSKSVPGSKSNSRPISASVPLMRQSLGAWEESAGASGAAAVKTLAGQVQALTAALATAAKDAADSKAWYANNLAHLEAAVATAEASAAACWEAYDMTFTEMVKRVASLLKSQCEGVAVPFHRPRSAARHASRPGSRPVSASVAAPNAAGAAGGVRAAASVNACGNETYQNTTRCSPNRRPVSAGIAGSCAIVERVSDSSAAGDSRAESPGRQPYNSPSLGDANSKRPQSAGAATWGWSEARGKQQQQQQFTSRPASAATHCSAGLASSSMAGGALTNRISGSSSIHALNQMNQRLCDENAWLLAELGKWEAGHHQKQVALAAATTQQAHQSLMPGSNVASSAISSTTVEPSARASSMAAAAAAAAANGDAHRAQSTSRNIKSSSNSVSEDGSTSVEGTEQAGNSREILARSANTASYPAGVPVQQALKLAVQEALQARKGPVLPALLLSGLSPAAGARTAGSSSGWAAAGSSRLVAALSAAEINMSLRTKVLQLESALAHLKAAHAADDTHIAQQQQRIRQLEQQQQQLLQQLEAARLQAEESQESAQQALQVAAAAVRQDGQANNAWSSNANHPDGATSSHAHSCGDGGGGGGSSSSSSAALVPGIAADDRLTCGGGYVRDLPVAAQQEIAAQRRVAAAAKRDKEVRSRELTQLEMRYSSLAAKLVKSRQAVSHKEGQIAQLQQALSAAHMALLDAGLESQQQQGVLTATASASAGDCGRQQHLPAAAGTVAVPSGDSGACSQTSAFAAAATTADRGDNDRSDRDAMNVALSCEESQSSFCSSRLTGAASTASALGVNAAAAASWSAAMEARDRTKQIQRLTGLCADKQAKVDSLKQELKKLQQQLSRQQRAADAALAAVQAEETSRRESLAGDLEGATTAMQEATRKLAASEVECSSLRQQLAAAERLQQQLELDVAYLRGRRAGPAAAAQQSSAAGTSISVGTCSCCQANQTGSMGIGADRSRGVKLHSVDACSINV